MKKLFALTLLLLSIAAAATESPAPAPEPRPAAAKPLPHPAVGTKVAANGLEITLVNKRQAFSGGRETYCSAINSPKSVNISPDGSKYYVNSLEGGKTVVFDAATDSLVAVVSHQITAAHDSLWAPASPLYPFTHYSRNNHFMGKPVEGTFTHGGRFFWVPYYRRSYDINAQDPSAVAVIDTRTDKIVRLFETGPLPKMIAASPDGKHLAITHWGNNTVGLMDIASSNPADWHHTACLVVDRVLPLNYSLTTPVDRDNGSGYALRGTAFTPDGRYLLVGCMGGNGGIAVFDVEQQKYLGRMLGMMNNVRHLIIHGPWLYLSVNGAGYVQRANLDDFLQAARSMNGSTGRFTAWENAKVGAGARTIAISPSGRYIFAACNNAARLCVVDTRTMKQIAEIAADPFPVGLDISADGSRVYTTSQGKKGRGGGNAVDIFSVTYPEPEIAPGSTPPAPDTERPRGTLPPDDYPATTSSTIPWPGIAGGIIAAAAALLAYRYLRK